MGRYYIVLRVMRIFPTVGVDMEYFHHIDKY